MAAAQYPPDLHEAIMQLDRLMELLKRVQDQTSDPLLQAMLDSLLEQLEDGRVQLQAFTDESRP
jgi:hypothetical protein